MSYAPAPGSMVEQIIVILYRHGDWMCAENFRHHLGGLHLKLQARLHWPTAHGLVERRLVSVPQYRERQLVEWRLTAAGQAIAAECAARVDCALADEDEEDGPLGPRTERGFGTDPIGGDLWSILRKWTS